MMFTALALLQHGSLSKNERDALVRAVALDPFIFTTAMHQALESEPRPSCEADLVERLHVAVARMNQHWMQRLN